MAPARRSSARLQTSTPRKPGMTPGSSSKLASLVERVETPDRGPQPTLNSIAASAPAKVSALVVSDHSLNTPSTSRIKPSFQDMHPSRHQSTAKKLESATRSVTHAQLQSPSAYKELKKDEAKKHAREQPDERLQSMANFEFRYPRPSMDLSSEAQKLMDEVREQAAKIRTELATQRSDQESKNDGVSGRKVAKAKSKIGRFSEVHLEEFKKMNSIANHPSSFRTQLPKPLTTPKALKRSSSKAGLDKSESDVTQSPLVTSKSAIAVPRPVSARAKRIKNDAPVVQEEKNSAPVDLNERKGPSSASKCSGLRQNSTILTPTKASVARSASVKSFKSGKSKIPSLTKSPSTNALSTPQALKPTQFNTDSKILSSFTNKLNSVKSILRRPHLKFSDDPLKLAAGTHVMTPQKPTTAEDSGVRPEVVGATPGSPSYRKEKHVNFSSSPDVLIPPSPSRSAPSPTFAIKYPTLPNAIPQTGSPTASRGVIGPGDFTFRSENTISFSTPDVASPTIRHVCSGSDSPDRLTVPAPLPGIAHGLSNKKRKRTSLNAEGSEDKENVTTIQDVEQSPSKKVKLVTLAPAGPVKTPTRKANTPVKKAVSSAKRRGVLSLSKLNALSQPKQRG